jgi:hypothetical protein
LPKINPIEIFRKRKMTWYCGHAILWARYLDGNQNEYIVWENIYLTKANNSTEAEKQIAVSAIAACDPDGLEFDGRPAQWKYGGIRKVIEISVSDFLIGQIDEDWGDTIELTWNQYVVPDKESLNKLISGESANVIYDE